MRQFKRPSTLPMELPKMKIRLALGMTCSNRNTLSVQPTTGTLAYPASGTVVLFDMVKKRQRGYIQHAKQAVSCLRYSPDGKLLLIGECGYLPSLHVWSTQQDRAVASIQQHSFGIVSAAFSKNMEVIVTVGTKHDGFIYVWAWPEQHLVACNKFAEDIYTLSFSTRSLIFVTCGVHNVKFWYPAEPKAYICTKPHLIQTLYGRPTILGGLKHSVFVDVTFGSGRTQSFVFSITRCGTICRITNTRVVQQAQRVANVEMSSLQVHDDELIVGTACGRIYLFDALTFQLRNTVAMPLDICFAEQVFRWRDNSLENVINQSGSSTFVVLDHEHRLLVSVLSNGSLCVWDVQDVYNVNKTYYSVSHSKPISAVDVIRSNAGDHKETILTVSHDSTIRLWNIAVTKGICCESSKIIYTEFDQSIQSPCEEGQGLEEPSWSVERIAITASKVSAEQDMIAAGDRQGRITVYHMDSLDKVVSLQHHTRGITQLAFFTQEGHTARILVSGSRDRLINIYNINRSFALVNTLHLHSGTIISLGLYSTGSHSYLVSAGLDRTVVICTSIMQQVHEFRPHSCHHTFKSVVDLVIDHECGQVGLGRITGDIRVVAIESFSQIRRFSAFRSKTSRLEKLQLDSNNSLLLCACSNHDISLLSFTDGALLTTVHGHAKGVSGLCFSLSSRYVVSTSKDGCYFIWALPSQALFAALKSKNRCAGIKKRKVASAPNRQCSITCQSVTSLKETSEISVSVNIEEAKESMAFSKLSIENAFPISDYPNHRVQCEEECAESGDETTMFMEDFAMPEDDVTSVVKIDDKSQGDWENDKTIDENRVLTKEKGEDDMQPILSLSDPLEQSEMPEQILPINGLDTSNRLEHES